MFSFGYMSIAGAVLLPILWFLSFHFRRFTAWSVGKEPPGEKTVVFIPVTMVLGLIVGSILQPQWDRISACTDQGYSYKSCMLDFGH